MAGPIGEIPPGLFTAFPPDFHNVSRAIEGEGIMADKNKVMWISVAAVAGFIAFANLSAGGSFGVSRETSGVETADRSDRPEPPRRDTSQVQLPGPNGEAVLTRRSGEPSIVTY